MADSIQCVLSPAVLISLQISRVLCTVPGFCFSLQISRVLCTVLSPAVLIYLQISHVLCSVPGCWTFSTNFRACCVLSPDVFISLQISHVLFLSPGVGFLYKFPACCFCPRLMDFSTNFCVQFLFPVLYKFPCCLVQLVTLLVVDW